MAKSTRSKIKRQWRAKKRDDSVYAVTEAARLHRLSQKLKIITQTDVEGDFEVEDATQGDEEVANTQDEMQGRYWAHALGLLDQESITPERMEILAKGCVGLPGEVSDQASRFPDDQQPAGANADTDAMQLDTESAPKRISTHGPRKSRREEWRESKGLPPRQKSTRMNRQGLPAAKRKSGRSHRRR